MGNLFNEYISDFCASPKAKVHINNLNPILLIVRIEYNLRKSEIRQEIWQADLL